MSVREVIAFKVKKMETKNWKITKDDVYGKVGSQRRDELDIETLNLLK